MSDPWWSAFFWGTFAAGTVTAVVDVVAYKIVRRDVRVTRARLHFVEKTVEQMIMSWTPQKRPLPFNLFAQEKFRKTIELLERIGTGDPPPEMLVPKNSDGEGEPPLGV